MRRTYRYDPQTKRLVEITPKRRAPAKGPFVWSDLPGYVSPVSEPGTLKWVEGRAARREDLKSNNCREVDPGEFKAEN